MFDHDQRFKTMIQEFFPEFLELFFPSYAATFDLTTIEWLEQEMFQDPPQGDVRILDLVARLMRRSDSPTETVALVHIEIESSDSVSRFHQRMYRYYESLRRKHNVPVLPISLFMRVGFDGIGMADYEERFDDLAVLRFQYLYVGLPALNAETYLNGDNWLGVGLSALMKMSPDEKVRFRAESLRRILLESNVNDFQKYLLSDCVEAYLPMDDAENSAFDKLLETKPYAEIRITMQTTYDKGVQEGIEQGIEQGREQERRVAILDVLHNRFPKVPEHIVRLVNECPVDQLRAMFAKAIRIESLDELSKTNGE